MAYRILVPRPGIKPGSPAVEVWSPNYWTTREFPEPFVFKNLTLQPKIQKRYKWSCHLRIQWPHILTLSLVSSEVPRKRVWKIPHLCFSLRINGSKALISKWGGCRQWWSGAGMVSPSVGGTDWATPMAEFTGACWLSPFKLNSCFPKRWLRSRGKSTGLGIRWMDPHSSPATWPRSSRITSLGLTVLNYKMGMITPFSSSDIRTKLNHMHVKALQLWKTAPNQYFHLFLVDYFPFLRAQSLEPDYVGSNLDATMYWLRAQGPITEPVSSCVKWQHKGRA